MPRHSSFPSERPNPELLVATGVLEAGPFGTAEFVEAWALFASDGAAPRPHTVGAAAVRRDVAAWYGPGTPIHLDGRAEVPLATIAYDVDGRRFCSPSTCPTARSAP